MAVYLQMCRRQLLCRRNEARASAPALWADKLEKPLARFVSFTRRAMGHEARDASWENVGRKMRAMGT